MNIRLFSNGFSCTVNTCGAELKSYRDPSGREYIWTSDPAFWMRSSPLLFPIVGNARDGRTILKNRIYALPKHGFCKESEFLPVEKREDFARFRLSANAGTLASYPYAFSLSLSYRLCGDCLQAEYLIENHDPETMYFQLGAHPGFLLPVSPGEGLSDCVLEFEYEEPLLSHPYDAVQHCFHADRISEKKAEGRCLPLSPALFDGDVIFLETLRSRRVALRHRKSGRGVSVSFPDFHSVAFWIPPCGNPPFLCIEPWNGSAIFAEEDDVLAHRRRVLSLLPGEAQRFRTEIRLLTE